RIRAPDPQELGLLDLRQALEEGRVLGLDARGPGFVLVEQFVEAAHRGSGGGGRALSQSRRSRRRAAGAGGAGGAGRGWFQLHLRGSALAARAGVHAPAGTGGACDGRTAADAGLALAVEDMETEAAVVRSDVVAAHRSEEHTSELQSRENLVCRLLLEKKNVGTPVSSTRRMPAAPRRE